MGSAALSHQDVLDLQEIAQHLPNGDPRQAKVATLLNSGPTEFERERTPDGGLKTLGKDLLGYLTPAAQNPYPGMGGEQKAQAAEQSVADDQRRKQAGYSGSYRALAPVAQSIGLNVDGIEESARKGDESGIYGHAAAPIVAYGTGKAAQGIPAAARVARTPIGAALSAASDVINPDVTGILSPRLAHLQRVAGKVGKAMQGAKPIPIDALSEAAANSHPIDALSEAASGKGPIEGDYLDEPQAIPGAGVGAWQRAQAWNRAQSDAHYAQVVPRTNRMLPESSSPGINVGEYRRGLGEVTPEIVGDPNRDILAGGARIVRKPNLLPAAKLNRARTAETVDDAGVNQEMMEWANAEDRAALLDNKREWIDRNSSAVPKWKRMAQFRAQMAAESVMREAEIAQQTPARLTKTRPAKADTAAGTSGSAIPPVELGEDLMPKLKESLRQAMAKKGQPRGGK